MEELDAYLGEQYKRGFKSLFHSGSSVGEAMKNSEEFTERLGNKIRRDPMRLVNNKTNSDGSVEFDYADEEGHFSRIEKDKKGITTRISCGRRALN